MLARRFLKPDVLRIQQQSHDFPISELAEVLEVPTETIEHLLTINASTLPEQGYVFTPDSHQRSIQLYEEQRPGFDEIKKSLRKPRVTKTIGTLPPEDLESILVKLQAGERPSQIAAEFGVGRQALNTHKNKLIQQGKLTRRAAPKDQ